jgi:hypothetical protein
MTQKRSCSSAPFASPIVESSSTSTSTRVVVRTLFVRCSYERELTRELRDAPVCHGPF